MDQKYFIVEEKKVSAQFITYISYQIIQVDGGEKVLSIPLVDSYNKFGGERRYHYIKIFKCITSEPPKVTVERWTGEKTERYTYQPLLLSQSELLKTLEEKLENLTETFEEVINRAKRIINKTNHSLQQLSEYKCIYCGSKNDSYNEKIPT